MGASHKILDHFGKAVSEKIFREGSVFSFLKAE
jgi:hypothetical protein